MAGYGLVEVAASRFCLVEAGVVRCQPVDLLELRLLSLHESFREVLNDCLPDIVSVEQLYSHYAHPRTAILMGHARGVILLAAALQGVGVVSYPATEIKRALTGSGRASKAQMQRMVQHRLNLTKLPSPPDVADALAVALCHGLRWRSRQLGSQG